MLHDWLIRKLNPIIRGWANYFRTGVAKEIFEKLDRWMFHKEYRYASRTHPLKPWYWRKERYWGRLNPHSKDNWMFGDKQSGAYLLKFSGFDIRRHRMVIGTHSPDDPRLKEYWKERNKTSVKDLPSKEQRIAKRQDSLCEKCGATLFNGELLHIHHVKPRKDGGGDGIHNLRLIHLFCHQQVHSKGTSK